MSKIYKITQEEKEQKIRKLDEIFLDDIERKKFKTQIFTLFIPLLGAVILAILLFVCIKFGLFLDLGFFVILAIWAVGVCAIYSISAAYGKTTNSYKRYKDALIRYERFLKSPEKFIYKKLDEFDLNDYHARVETINLDNAKWTIVIGKNEEEQDEFENLGVSKDQIIEHNKSVIANEISVILNKNKEILKKVTDKNGNNFYDVYKSYAFYNELLKLEAYERALKELKEMLNEIDKIKFKAVFQKE